MNFENIEMLWESEALQGSKRIPLEDIKQIARATRRSQSRRRWILSCSGFNLCLATVACGYIGLSRATLHSGDVLPLAGALLACWAVYGVLVHRFLAERRAARHAGDSLQDFITQGLRQVRGESHGLKLIAALMVLIYGPLLPWAVAGLVASGKMNAHAALCFAALVVGQILFFAVFCLANYFGSIRPRTKRLQALGEALGLDTLEPVNQDPDFNA